MTNNSPPVDNEGEAISFIASSTEALSIEPFSDNLSSITIASYQTFDQFIASHDGPYCNELDYNSTDRYHACSFPQTGFQPIPSHSTTGGIQPALFIFLNDSPNTNENTTYPIHDEHNQNSKSWTRNALQTIEADNSAVASSRTPANMILSGIQKLGFHYSKVVHKPISEEEHSSLVSKNIPWADETFSLAEGYANTSFPGATQAQSLLAAALYGDSRPLHEHTVGLMGHYRATHAAIYPDTTRAHAGSAADFDDETPPRALITEHVSTQFQLERWLDETSDKNMTWTEKLEKKKSV